MIAFAVSGANTVSPLDSSAGMPRTQEDPACPSGQPCSTGVSTSGPDFVFQFAGDTGSTRQSAGAGFTMLSQNTAGPNVYAEYELASAPLSSATLSFGTTQTSDFGVIADAIVPATSTAPATTTTTSSTTSNTTTTTTSNTTTTTATSSTTNGSTNITTAENGVFYLGAEAAGTSNPANTGVHAYIDVQPFSVTVGCVAFWVSDDSAADIWMQAGYYICDGSSPVVFMQVWNLDSYTVLYTDSLNAAPTTGTHQFSVYLQSGTTWVAAYDGRTIGSYDMQASTSSASYPIFSTSEENGIAAPVPIPTIGFPVAIQALIYGVWTTPAAIQAYNSGADWGLQGPAQNSTLPSNSFEVGGSLPTLTDGSPL
jgi:hypothetical protein